MDYEISPEELKVLLDGNPDVVVLDVREPWEIETAAFAGSVNIPMGNIPAKYSERLDHAKHVIVICHHGVRSMNVTAWLRQQGMQKVQSLCGGIDSWARQIDPKVPLY